MLSVSCQRTPSVFVETLTCSSSRRINRENTRGRDHVNNVMGVVMQYRYFSSCLIHAHRYVYLVVMIFELFLTYALINSRPKLHCDTADDITISWLWINFGRFLFQPPAINNILHWEITCCTCVETVNQSGGKFAHLSWQLRYMAPFTNVGEL